MGQSVDISCRCGVRKTLMIGAGMLSEASYGPGFCDKCGTIQEISSESEDPSCGTCRGGTVKRFDRSLANPEQRPELHMNAVEITRRDDGEYECEFYGEHHRGPTIESVKKSMESYLGWTWRNKHPLYDFQFLCPGCGDYTLKMEVGDLMWD